MFCLKTLSGIYAVYLLVLMLCVVGTLSVYLLQPMIQTKRTFFGIDVYLLLLMLCIVGTHAVYLWHPMFFSKPCSWVLMLGTSGC